jgi:hypothetical protein
MDGPFGRKLEKAVEQAAGPARPREAKPDDEPGAMAAPQLQKTSIIPLKTKYSLARQ